MDWGWWRTVTANLDLLPSALPEGLDPASRNRVLGPGRRAPGRDRSAEEVARLRMRARVGDLTVTFHRAFDMTADPRSALDTLLEVGFHRVLTSGQAANAADATELLAELQRQAGERLRIVPAGGVDETNVARVVAETGVREVHSTAMLPIVSQATHRNPAAHMGREIDEYAGEATDASRVARLVALAGGA